MKPLIRLLPLALGAAPCAAAADTVVLANGDRLTGEIIALDSDKLKLKTSYGGEVTLAWDAISGLRSDQPLYVTAADGTHLQALVDTAPDGRLVLETGGPLGTLNLPMEAVSGLRRTPPPPVVLSGSINLGVSTTSGNTETEAYHVAAQLVARTLKNRYALSAEAAYESDGDERTVNEASASAVYDHFLTPRWYINSHLSLARDEFEDLELRSTIGAGAGYQIVEDADTQAAVELGISYVREDFEAAADEGNPAARWAFNYQQLLTEDLSVFHQHEVFVNLEEAENTLVQTRTGLRIPIASGLSSTIQLDYDYDGEPAPEAERSDRAVLVTLGYVF